MHTMQSRRRFLTSLSVAGAAGIFDSRGTLAAEGPPETTTIRLKKSAAICFAPVYVVEAFLNAEGFTDVQYVAGAGGLVATGMVEQGDVDIDVDFAGSIVLALDSGAPLTALGGLHVGCYELFAREPIRTVADLKGRRVAVNDSLLGGEYVYVSIMATHVGLDPNRDIEWVIADKGNALELYAAGETDAFLGFPPEPQRLRTLGHHRVILSTVLDRPWSQYFCCMMYSSRAWVRDHPVATKRFLRAMYKAADFCTAEPARAAQQLVDGGYADRYDYALETIEAIPYDLWHEYDAEDTLRFYALRLHEAGMLNNSPNALIAEGTDWRFINELKRELKA